MDKHGMRHLIFFSLKVAIGFRCIALINPLSLLDLFLSCFRTNAPNYVFFKHDTIGVPNDENNPANI